MKCSHIKTGEINAIVCGATRLRTCQCGQLPAKMCDWKTDYGFRTCDAPLCDACAQSPAPGKDLCPRHWAMWQQHPANPARK